MFESVPRTPPVVLYQVPRAAVKCWLMYNFPCYVIPGMYECGIPGTYCLVYRIRYDLPDACRRTSVQHHFLLSFLTCGVPCPTRQNRFGENQSAT